MQTRTSVSALGSELSLLLSEDGLEDACPIQSVPLTPNQAQIADQILSGLSVGEACLLQGDAGMGKTTILKHIQNVLGGPVICIGQFLSLLKDRAPAALEETFLELVEQRLRAQQVVVIDDLQLLMQVVDHYNYSRTHLLESVLMALLAEAERLGKKLVFAAAGEAIPWVLRCRAYVWKLPEWDVEDYRALCSYYLSAKADIDYNKIYRFAPALNGYQLRKTCLWLRQHSSLTTEEFVDYLCTHNMASNVDIVEVTACDWSDLKGVDDVIQELEAKIALPFEQSALASQLQLKPKRGVLLAGPPGTGKTTVGRALARRLRSKFFLIDGTVVAESGDFYSKVERIFADAKKNAPSIIFIDDADVIFEDRNQGFYRYLLTMMDGLESASAERVCVMMTAMEVSSLPPAMLRSGRVELWLHTRLPDVDARAHILRERIGPLPSPLADVDVIQIAQASDGLTGADLKAVVEDAKLLYAHDLANGRALLSVEKYFLRAVGAVRDHQKRHRSRGRSSFTASRFGFAAGMDLASARQG